jgi:uncharacterized small protein (DUF1192 family)
MHLDGNPLGPSGLFCRKRPMAALGSLRRAATKIGAVPMPSNLSPPELDDRIAVLRDNIRQLIEQAAGASGGQNEERAADRIAQQTAELDKLVAEREELGRK